MDFTMLFMSIGLGTSFILLYARKKKWNTDMLRWLITGILFLVGLVGFIVDREKGLDQGFYFLCIPLMYNCFDRWFKLLSMRKLGRDFYLYLSHSDEIDVRMWGDNPHVKTLDKVFSFSLILIIMGLMVSGALLSRSLNH